MCLTENNYRICTKCGNKHPKTKEYFYIINKDIGKFSCQCKSCKINYSRKYYRENREKCIAVVGRWQKNNPEKCRIATMRWMKKNAEKCRETARRWKENNPEKWKAKQRRNITKINATPKGKINNRIRSAMSRALKGNKNGRSWESLIGYTCDDLMRHIEKLFVNGMTWDKFLKGEIHIDHKIPISAFNFTKPEHEDFKRCWALKNLRPLWKYDNLTKYNKIKKPFQPSLLL